MRNDYEIRGEITAIFLNRKDGTTFESFVDTKDLELLNQFKNKWYPKWDKTTKSFYVYGHQYFQGKMHSVFLHRYLLNAKKNLVVDHINHNTLDNRRSNLRLITRAQNNQNRKGAQVNSESGIRGVHWIKKHNKYQAFIQINNKGIQLGLFDDINKAEKAVIEARKKLMPYSCETEVC
ncbi:hypothetical protein B4102_3402 [Heyndrickxia sporothermodurans]|uniref:HNH nuclease domain-containing protein n=1 Tax=Heyndrickxia sporothermodurans TaxID=46224 RepID=A0A150KU83_9BACI|nr:HNH endonuclease [Heyndrickxia sporothermodurans]KYD03484.1 hypothetical protein B4102_3402 [Heyndrickxia sporothermodurans]